MSLLELKIDKFLLIGTLFLMLVTIYFLLVIPDISYYQTEHLKFSSLMTSGKTSDQYSLYSFIFCVGMVWVYFGSLLLSTQHLTKNKQKKIQILMFCFCSVYLYLLSSLVFSNDLIDQTFYFGFPRATAIMIYLIAFSPLFLSFIYIRYFDKFIITEAAFKNFKKNIKSQNK
jgi:hypothetical protein